MAGHGPGQEVLQVRKKSIDITQVEPVGSYAVQFVFSDGHDSGIYSWDYFYRLGMKQDEKWRNYLQRLKDAGASREPGTGGRELPGLHFCAWVVAGCG